MASFTERVTLFVCAMHQERSLELLEGLADAPRSQARAFARAVAAWDSPTRQARLQREFAPRSDAFARIERLVLEAPPALRFALVDRLPAQWRGGFPHLQGRIVAPALRAVATQLLRETLMVRPVRAPRRH